MQGVFASFAGWRLPRYVLACAVALSVDLALYLAMLAIGIWPAAAAAVAYSAGIVAHWLLSSRAVFGPGVAPAGLARTRQKALFAGSALTGLGLTTMVVWAGEAAGADPRLAKLAAVGISFTATWLLRSQIIFRHEAAGR